MKRTAKSHCPVNFTLETVCDSWSMLIIRDIVFGGKKTHSEFMASEERIATNILANRLKHLVEVGILVKSPDVTDKRKDVYALSEKGLDLIPILFELSYWGTNHDPETIASKEFAAKAYERRQEVVDTLRESVRNGGALFATPDNVAQKMYLL